MSLLTRRNFLGSVAAASGLVALRKVFGTNPPKNDSKPANTMLNGKKNDFFRILDTPGTRISGLTIDGDAQNQNERQVGGILVRADNCIIEDSEIFNCSGQGVYVQAGKNLKIRRCKIHNIWRQGIAFYGGTTNYSGTVIEENEILRTQYEAIQIGGHGIIVRGNHLYNSPFGGLYALTGSKNFEITRNLVEDGFGGFDLSWGETNARVGTALSRRKVSENVILRCVNGIGTAGNGTMLHDNTILDGGKGHQPTYTLLGVTMQVASSGAGYAVGDVLSFIGGETTWNPAKARVEQVDAQGGIVRLSIWYLGCYTKAPVNPIRLAGGTGSGGSAQISRWNQRLFVPNGIMIMDASYCAVTGNMSGNSSPENRTQKVGCLLVYTFDQPLKNTIVGNSFPMNLDYPVMGFSRGAYKSSVLTGNTIGMNAS